MKIKLYLQIMCSNIMMGVQSVCYAFVCFSAKDPISYHSWGNDVGYQVYDGIDE